MIIVLSPVMFCYECSVDIGESSPFIPMVRKEQPELVGAGM